MAVQTNTFKGARYVPKFADPIEWSADNSYEAIESVQHNGFTYLSKQPVPAGVQIDNTDFWLEWADPNAQMEQLRQEVGQYAGNVEELNGVVGQWGNELHSEIIAREEADKNLDIYQRNIKQIIEPVLHGTFRIDATMNYHIGGICNANGYQFVIASPRVQNTNEGIIQTVSIEQNSILTRKAIEVGHANSICFNKNNNRVYIAPIRNYDDNTDANYLYEYEIDTVNNTLMNGVKVNVDMVLRGITFDPVKNHMYGVAGDSIYVFDELSKTFSLKANIPGIELYNQDIAVYNDKFVLCDASQRLYYIGDFNNIELYQTGQISVTDAYQSFYMFEVDGIEFTDDGTLLISFDTTINNETAAFICSYPLYSDGSFSRNTRYTNWSKNSLTAKLKYDTTALNYKFKSICELCCCINAPIENCALDIESDIDLSNTGLGTIIFPSFIKNINLKTHTLNLYSSAFRPLSTSLRIANGSISCTTINSATLAFLSLTGVSFSLGAAQLFLNPQVGCLVAIDSTTTGIANVFRNVPHSNANIYSFEFGALSHA